MCKSLIKKITKIENSSAYSGRQKYQMLFFGAKVGDNILVYGDLAMRKIGKKDTKELERISKGEI